MQGKVTHFIYAPHADGTMDIIVTVRAPKDEKTQEFIQFLYDLTDQDEGEFSLDIGSNIIKEE